MKQKKASRERLFYIIRRNIVKKYPILTDREASAAAASLVQRRGKKEAAKK